jgi:anti-sigma B factor antagonist
MTFTQQNRADASGLVIAVAGEMDYTVSGTFEANVQRLLDHRRPAAVRVDLSELDFIDSTAVSVLVRLWRLARRGNCSLRVVNAQGLVRHVLDVTGALAIVGAGPTTDADPVASG